MTIHITDAPQRLCDLWMWVAAIDSWVYCDPYPLAELIKSEDIPAEFKRVVSSIIIGDKKQNKKGAARIKIPANKRMDIAVCIDSILGILDSFKYGTVAGGESFCCHVGDKKGVEPLEIMQQLHEEQKNLIKGCAKEHGVSTETIENLLRDMRRYINDWPVV